MLLIIIIAILLASSGFSEANPAKNKTQVEWELIGEVNGRRFFAYGNWANEFSWSEARDMCSRAGFQLASINTVQEEMFLYQALSNRFNDTDISHYWTSGRDRLDKRQYIWDSTGDELAIEGEIDYYGPLSCLTIAVPDYDVMWDVRECTEVWPFLCND